MESTIKLQNVTLENFAEYFERDFERFICYATSDSPYRCLFFDHPREIPNSFSQTSHGTIIRILRHVAGNTQRSWMIGRIRRNELVLEFLFSVVVSRYRTDRIEVFVEADDAVHIEKFEQLMSKQWKTNNA